MGGRERADSARWEWQRRPVWRTGFDNVGPVFESKPPTPRERLITALGGYSTLLYWYRALRPRWLWRLTSPFGRPISRYVREQGLAVKRGPFQGLAYPKSSLGHTNYLSAKLAGAYEPGVVEFLMKHIHDNDVFVDVGSGDGFFCIGVARLASLRVIGFETNRFERRLAGKLARKNGVEFEARGSAAHAELNALPNGRMLLLWTWKDTRKTCSTQSRFLAYATPR